MSSKVELTGGKFQDAEGNVLAGGYLIMYLNQDESVSGAGIICAGIPITITLNSSGSANTSQYVWGNDVMSPINSYYRVTGYAADGTVAFGPNNQQVTGSGTFDLGTWTPNAVISWFPEIQQQLEIEIAGTPFSSETLLNFESSDSTITITDEGGGLLNLQNPSKITLQVNGSNTADQNKLNLYSSDSSVAITDEGSGAVNLQSGVTFNTSGSVGFWSAGVNQIFGTTNSGGSVSTTNEQVTVFLFTLSAAWTINTVYLYNETSDSLSSYNFGIYSLAGNKLLDTGAISCSGTGLKTASLGTPVTLSAGTYYFAQSANRSAAPTMRIFALPSSTEQGAILNAAGRAVAVGQAANLTSAGVMPATLGTITGGVTVSMAVVYFAP